MSVYACLSDKIFLFWMNKDQKLGKKNDLTFPQESFFVCCTAFIYLSIFLSYVIRGCDITVGLHTHLIGDDESELLWGVATLSAAIVTSAQHLENNTATM